MFNYVKKNSKQTLKRVCHRLGYELQPVRAFDSDQIHFLHIGKCAGTAIENVLEQVNQQSGRKVFVKHPHTISLSNIPRNQRYFFSVRHPVDRFKSAFYSRKRRGQPRINSPWSPDEELAFAKFDHATDLAESLFSNNKVGVWALQAIKSISHTSYNQLDWFCGSGFIWEHAPLAILRVEKLETDIGFLLRSIGINVSELAIEMPKTATKRHSNNYDGIPELSEKAQENLMRWYAQDVAFFEICCDWASRQD